MFRSDRRRRRFQLLVIGLLLVLVAGACGSSADPADEVATLEVQDSDLEDAADAATVAGAEAAEAAEDLLPDEAALEFSQCMRDEGLDFPDLSVNARGEIELRAAFQSVNRDAGGFREAMDVCGEILQQTGFGGGRGGALESTEIQDALLEFTACLRSEGYDVGDLTLGGPGPGQGQDQGQDQDDGDAAGAGQQGQRQGGFGERGARFADGLGLDYEDADVQEAVDGCMTVVDEAFAATGLGRP